MQVSHRFAAESAVFDDDNLVSCAGLVPVMGLAEQTGLPGLLADKVTITGSKIKSGAANPAPKLLSLIAGMAAGADSIDDVDVVRAGGMKAVFGGVYAPSAIGTLLREFSFGHARQLESVLGHHKQGASYGHTKIVGRQILRKGLSPLATTLSTDLAAPIIAGMRLRAGKAGSGRGAARMVAQAVICALAAAVTGTIMVRGDSAYGTEPVVRA